MNNLYEICIREVGQEANGRYNNTNLIVEFNLNMWEA